MYVVHLPVQSNHQWEKTKPNSQQQSHQVDDERRHQAAQPRRRYLNDEGVKSYGVKALIDEKDDIQYYNV